jgi:hypothetical protein
MNDIPDEVTLAIRKKLKYFAISLLGFGIGSLVGDGGTCIGIILCIMMLFCIAFMIKD